MRLSIGIDIGGTFIKGGVVSEDGSILKFTKVETPKDRDVEKTLKKTLSLIKGLKEESQTTHCVGVAIAGCVSKEGIVIFSPNFPAWKSVPLRSLLEQELGEKVIVDNDANAYGFGEREVGCAQGVEDFVLLTLGTGVGGAVFSQGKMIRGYLGIGAELGHILVGEEYGPTCGCGNRGCLETYASLSGLSKIACKGIPLEEPGKLVELYKAGDEKASRVINIFKKHLIRAIISYVHIFNPKLVVLGGGLSRDFREILQDIGEKVNEMVMPAFRNTFEIRFSLLSDEAGAVGIALMAIKAEQEYHYL